MLAYLRRATELRINALVLIELSHHYKHNTISYSKVECLLLLLELVLEVTLIDVPTPEHYHSMIVCSIRDPVRRLRFEGAKEMGTFDLQVPKPVDATN